MLYPGFYEYAIDKSWAGQELTDPVLSRWLINKYSFRIIGNVVQGPAWPVLDMNPEPEPEIVPSDQGWMSIHCI